ncbi:hypothetical protein [Simiduia aestuariiviva]|uniref:Uncharacterized protein n=1 Tax=Simiduia aestuariiviva TaxID=1510459 RepID=A0A839UKL0_9GAMM|nr:hypothetical protein [Simiduia aestuariiviva]MBB3167119.1 hypothetical protein [Simiduia aestuariiviva]
MSNNVHSELIATLVGKQVRIYTTGDFLTQDHLPDRVNIELSETRHIVRIWQG